MIERRKIVNMIELLFGAGTAKHFLTVAVYILNSINPSGDWK